jgi:hypothetical protein
MTAWGSRPPARNEASAAPPPPRDDLGERQRRAGQYVLWGASLILLAVSIPVVIRGAPLADDFHNCLMPQRDGLGGFLSASFDRLGLVRPARFVEILVTTGVCRSLPFGLAIAVGLVLTFLIAFLLRKLLKVIGSPAPWPEVGAAIWLLQPLGSEAALWPAALHVPLGLAAALASLLSVRGGHRWRAAMFGAGAMLCVEQTILALPLATYLVAPRRARRTASLAMIAVAGGVLVSYAMVPGNDPRLAAGLGERLQGLVDEPLFYLTFPGVGAGGQSIPMAVAWLLPLSLAVLVGGAIAGWRWAALPREQAEPHHKVMSPRILVSLAALAVLINIPVFLGVPRQGSPRIFAPLWLFLSLVLALWAGRVRWRNRQWACALAGVYLAGAALSLGLSAWVRVQTADVVERVAVELAARTADGDVVALCDVPRTVVSPAPRGAFHVQDYFYDWAAADAVSFYTGRRVVVRVQQVDDQGRCASGTEDLIVSFDELSRQ